MKKVLFLSITYILALVLTSSAQTVDTAMVVISGGQAVVIDIPKTVTSGVRTVSRSLGNETNYQQIGTLSRPASFSAFSNAAGDTVVRALKKMKKISSDAELWDLIQRNPSYKEFGAAMISLKFLKAIGWAYTDNTLNKLPNGTKVYYKITDPGSGKTEAGSCITGQQPGDIAPKLIRKRSSDSLVYLRWGYKKPRAVFFPRYAYVYMKDQGGSFRKQQFYAYGTIGKDSVYFSVAQHVKPRLEYTYYIQPVDFFNNPTAAHSDTVSLISVDFTRTPPVEKVKAKDTTNGILITWKKKSLDLFLSGILIERANSSNGNYTEVVKAAVTDSSYLDRNVISGQQYYYRLRLVGQNEPELQKNNFSGYTTASHSARFQRPDAPYALKAGITPQGVQLNWQAVSSPATAGYFVYRSSKNDTTGMLQISGLITGTTFTDSAKDQPRRINYNYAVKAVNLADLKSNYSATTQARLPVGTDKPLIPAYINVSRNGDEVSIKWENTKAADNYIQGYVVYKRKLTGGEHILNYDPKKTATEEAARLGFKRITTTIISTPEFNEAITNNDTSRYVYAVAAIDITGAESGLSALGITPIDSVSLAGPTGLKAIYIDKQVQLKWFPRGLAGLTGFRIYRKAMNEKGYTVIGTVSVNTTSFNDATVHSPNVYLYKIRSVGHGGESTAFAGNAIAVN